jgi:hypothetical protein
MSLSKKAIIHLSSLQTADVDNKQIAIRKLIAAGLMLDAEKVSQMSSEEYDAILMDDIGETLS